MPALPVALGLATGVAASLWIDTWWIGLPTIAVGIALWIIGKHWWSVCCICASAGLILAVTRMPHRLPQQFLNRSCEVTATIAKSNEKDSHINYIIDVDSVKYGNQKSLPLHIRATMRSYRRLEALPIGTKILAKGDFQHFESKPLFAWQTDLSVYQRVERISAVFQPDDDQSIVILLPPTSIIDKITNEGGAWLKHAIVNTGYDEETTHFLLATLSGDDRMLDSEKVASFRSAGVAHLLALSGLHTGIIYSIAAILLWGIKIMPRGRNLYFAILACFVMLYAICVGFSPSVARAAMMVCVFSFVKIIDGQFEPCNSLCLTIAIWLLYSPEWLFSASFQMSVAAVSAIIWVNHLTKSFDGEHRLQRKIILIFAVPVAAMAATAALSVFYFNTFPSYFLVANILITYPATLIIGLAAVCTLLSALGFHSTIIIWIVDQGYRLIDKILASISHWPNALIEGIQPSIYQYIAYLALLICTVWFVQYRRKAAFISLLMLVGGLTISFTTAKRDNGQEVYLLGREYFNAILLRNNDTIAVAGNFNNGQFKTLEQKLHQYAVNRGCRHIIDAKKTFDSGNLRLDHQLLMTGNKTVVILQTNEPITVSGHVDYLYLGNLWRGDVMSTSRAVKADTVVISEGINKKRRDRYLATLHLIGQPAKEAPTQIQ